MKKFSLWLNEMTGAEADAAGMAARAAYEKALAEKGPLKVNSATPYSTPYGHRPKPPPGEPAPPPVEEPAAGVAGGAEPTPPSGWPPQFKGVQKAIGGMFDVADEYSHVHNTIIDVQQNGTNASRESYDVLRILKFMINKLELTDPERVKMIMSMHSA